MFYHIFLQGEYKSLIQTLVSAADMRYNPYATYVYVRMNQEPEATSSQHKSGLKYCVP